MKLERFADLPGRDKRTMLCAYQAGLNYAQITSRALFALSLAEMPGYVRMTCLEGFPQAYVAFLHGNGGDLIE